MEPAQQPVTTPSPQPKVAGGLAIAALVVGIVAFLSGWAPVWGLLVGAAALVLGIVALNKKQSKVMSIFGIVLGSLAIISSILATLFWGAVFNAAQHAKTSDTTSTNQNGTANLAKQFSVSKLTYATDGTQKVLAEITNNSNETHSVTLRITFYDASGNILGTASGTTYDIEPGQSKTFDSTTVEDVSGYTKTTDDFYSVF